MSVDIQEIEKDILGEAYVSNEPQLNLLKLCSFGSRFAGTPSEKRAVSYLKTKMTEYELDNPHTEMIEYLGWRRGTTTMEVTSPITKQLECIGLPWTPSTPPNGVEAELLNLGNGTHIDYDLAKNEVSEKIVMTTAFTPPWMRGQHRCEKLCRAENLGAVGFIYAKNDPGLLCETGVASWNPPEVLGRIVRFPAVGTSKEVAAYLTRLQREGTVKIRLTTNHSSGPETTWNVIGDITGYEKPNEILIAGAHFDGHDIAVGAMDDAAGTCVILEAARLLVKHKTACKRTIRFIAFPGEETGCFGSAGYVNQHLQEMERIKFMFNLDGAGRASRPSVMVQGWSDTIPIFRELSTEMRLPMMVGVSFSLYSDHMPFTLRGIPTATIRGESSFTGWTGTRGWGHTKADTEDKVDIRDMRETAATLARLLLRLATRDDLPLARKTNEEIRRMLHKYECDEVMKVLGSYPSWLN